MNEFSETELFSAYLDGELTADEQVRVEQVLATSPEARQMLEELRALGSTLQSLPQQKLDENLAERVLKMAERRVLSPEQDKSGESDKSAKLEKPSAGRAAAAMSTSADEASDAFPWRELSWRGMFTPRALIWSAVIVIVGIIIRFTSPTQHNRDVARLDDNQTAAVAASSSENETRQGGQATSEGSLVSGDKAKNDKAIATDGKPSMVAKSAKESAASSEIELADGKLQAGLAMHADQQDGAAKRKEAAPALPTAEPMIAQAPPAPLVAKPAAKPAADLASSDEEHRSDAKAPEGKAEDRSFKVAMRGTAPSKAAGRMPEEASEKDKDASQRLAADTDSLQKQLPAAEKKMAAPQAVVKNEPAPVVTAPQTTAPQAPPPQIVGTLLPAAAAPAAPPFPPAKAAAQGFGPGSGQGIMVVRLNISAEAARSRVFNELLAHNGLAARELPEHGRREIAKSEAPQGAGANAALEQTKDGATLNSATLNGAYSGSLTPQQVAGPLLSETTQNGASRAMAVAPRRAVATASEAQSGNAPQSQSAPAADQPQAAQQDFGAASNSRNQMSTSNGDGAAVLYYDCEATPEQLTALLEQIGQHGDAFSPPQVVSSSASLRDQRSRSSGEQESSAYNYGGNELGAARNNNDMQNDAVRNGQSQNKQDQAAQASKGSVAGGAAPGAAGSKQAKFDPPSSPADKYREVPKPQQGGGGGQLYYQSAASTPSSANTGKTHVRFVLSVVDHVAPPLAPAAAAPAPASGK